MNLTINLDENPDGNPGPGSPPPEVPPPPPPRGQKRRAGDKSVKRLQLPMIGNQPVGFQLQVMLAAFVVFLALAGYIGIMDARSSANRSARSSSSRASSPTCMSP